LPRGWRVAVLRVAAPSNDVLALIEVADSSLAYDRDVKLPRYACAGIPEVWILDLTGRRLLIHRHPDGNRYMEVAAPDELAALDVPVTGQRRLSIDLRGLV